MNRKLIVSVIFGLLIIVTLVQAIQLTSLKAQLNSNSFTALNTQSSPAGAVASSNNPTAGNAHLPSSLENLPSMVGGC